MKRFAAFCISAVLALGISLSPARVYAERIAVVSLNSGYAGKNTSAEVSLNIQSEGISAYSIEVNFDSRVLSFESAGQGTGLDGGSFYFNDKLSDDRVVLVWSNSRNQKCYGEAAVLKFRARYDTDETDTALNIGYVQLADDLTEEKYVKQDCVVKIAGEIKKGDANCDNTVDVSDVVALNLYLLDGVLYPLDYTGQANADVTGNGNVTSTDSVIILNYVCMMIEEL